jgi:hypothetical protein
VPACPVLALLGGWARAARPNNSIITERMENTLSEHDDANEAMNAAIRRPGEPYHDRQRRLAGQVFGCPLPTDHDKEAPNAQEDEDE